MILNALKEEFRLLFNRQAHARIALWFDEKREFERLLPVFARHLGSRSPLPFTFLRYDEKAGQGQLWLKAQVHWMNRNLPVAEREAQRYVIYLPFSADRLETVDEETGFCAEFLLEYRYLGVTWRVDGKLPTLFSFLRKADVSLPVQQQDQRLLWDGGPNSLLAKFAARFADRDDRYWRHEITPAWARQQVVGDVEQTVMDLATDPSDTVTRLIEDVLLEDCLPQVREAFGYCPSVMLTEATVEKWLCDLVAHLALTETYVAYGEAADFPFLPMVLAQPHHARAISFLKRWLKDGVAAESYHRIIRLVESDHDLTGWAKGKAGSSFAFPHLTRLRWSGVYDQFRSVSKQKTLYEPFLIARIKELKTEADYVRQSPDPVRGFELLARLGDLVIAKNEALEMARSAGTAEAAVELYVTFAGRVDRMHWRLLADAMKEAGLEELSAVANRVYGEYLTFANTTFFNGLKDRAEWKVANLPEISQVMRGVWNGERPLAVVIVDALRYDGAIEIAERLGISESAVSATLACIPSRTWVGMTALLGLENESLRYESAGGEGRLRLSPSGSDLSARANRLQFLRDRRGAHCVEIEEIESSEKTLSPFPDLLCVFGHETIDSLGHDNAGDLIRHLEVEVDRLVQLVRKLHSWGYVEVHVVTDHGFIITSDGIDIPVVPLPADRVLTMKSRYAMVSEDAVLEAKTFPFPLASGVRVAVPAGVACFKSEKSFDHGGATLQEVVIPHLVSRKETGPTRVEVRVWPASFEIKTHAVKIVLEAIVPEGTDSKRRLMGRTVEVDLLRDGASVLARHDRKEIPPVSGTKVSVVLMLDDQMKINEGESLDLVVRDAENQETLSPAGMKLSVKCNL